MEMKRVLLKMCIRDRTYIDSLLIQTDGTDNKSNLGANATLGVSMAVARAAAMALRIPLYQYIGGCHANRMPVPMMNILNGGRHADNTVDLQEFMIMPVGASCFSEGIRMCVEIYQSLRILLKKKNLSTACLLYTSRKIKLCRKNRIMRSIMLP